MGQLEAAKWKAFSYKHPDLLQKIEDEYHIYLYNISDPEYNVNYLREQIVEN